ncbi:uncharacterized protein BKA78DRAFT_59714 [Phyllosticta capitalensis]|uniref:uncharacterized protein n=1 Tax=Phyllosticta capitalensis TaxID=121624 RepID=UPI00312E9218
MTKTGQSEISPPAGGATHAPGRGACLLASTRLVLGGRRRVDGEGNELNRNVRAPTGNIQARERDKADLMSSLVPHAKLLSLPNQRVPRSATSIDCSGGRPRRDETRRDDSLGPPKGKAENKNARCPYAMHLPIHIRRFHPRTSAAATFIPSLRLFIRLRAWLPAQGCYLCDAMPWPAKASQRWSSVVATWLASL